MTPTIIPFTEGEAGLDWLELTDALASTGATIVRRAYGR